MFTRNRMMGMAIACLAVGTFFMMASTPASADDGRLIVAPAVYQVDPTTPGPTTQLVRYGYYRGGWGPGYRGAYWRGYGYRPYYRSYYYGGYPAYANRYPAYGYPAYGYGPGYGYGYYGPGVTVGVW